MKHARLAFALVAAALVLVGIGSMALDAFEHEQDRAQGNRELYAEFLQDR